MEHQINQVTSTSLSVGDTISTGRKGIQSLQKENEAVREQVVRLQKSERQLQRKRKRSVKRRRAHTMDCSECFSKLTEKRWQLKEVERERKADAERWKKKEEEWRVTEARANSFICILQDQLQALKREKEKLSKRGRYRTIKTSTELESTEARWKEKLRKLYGIYERELALRDKMWRRKVKNLEEEKQKDAERWQKREELWKMAERREHESICELVPKAEKGRETEREHLR